MKRFAVSIEIEDDRHGGLRLWIKPVDPAQRLEAEPARAVLTFWAESSDTLRARIENLRTGATGYLQGNATLLAFCAELGLKITGP